MINETWATVALPTLRWCAEHPDASELDPAESMPDIDRADIDREVARLYEAGYLSGTRTSGPDLLRPRLTERGLRAAEVWPPEDAYDGLVHTLDNMIDQADTPETKSRLVKVRDAVGGLGRDVGVNVVATFAATRMGI